MMSIVDQDFAKSQKFLKHNAKDFFVGILVLYQIGSFSPPAIIRQRRVHQMKYILIDDP